MLAESTFTTTDHLAALLGFAVCTAAFIVSGKRRPEVTRWVFAGICLAAWLLSSVFYLLPANLEPHMSLPIQACDLLALFAVITLALPSRMMRSVMYFGGFGMTTQAFATPTSDIGGPDNIKFWIFWSLHGVIVATAIYIVVVDKFRPTLKDFIRASLFWLTYAFVMIGVNYTAFALEANDGKGWYYGYLGPHVPDIVAGSVIQFLGEWPVRPMRMILVILTIFVLIYLPWVFVPKRNAEDTSNAA